MRRVLVATIAKTQELFNEVICVSNLRNYSWSA